MNQPADSIFSTGYLNHISHNILNLEIEMLSINFLYLNFCYFLSQLLDHYCFAPLSNTWITIILHTLATLTIVLQHVEEINSTMFVNFSYNDTLLMSSSFELFIIFFFF